MRRFRAAASKIPRASRTTNPSKPRFQYFSGSTYSSYAARRQQHFWRSLALVSTVGTVAAVWQWYGVGSIRREIHAEEPAPETELIVEKIKRKRGLSREERRNLISSQHLQVKRSWENPGVYAWGSNSGGVVAPDSEERFIKTPRRISFFDGKLLRDLKLDRNFGAAIDEQGDLLQWGTAFSREGGSPVITLKGKDLKSLAISRDRIMALASDGKVYSLPVSKDEQNSGPKPDQTSWIPFWNSKSSVSYRALQPKDMPWGEKVSSIAGGLEHILLLTSKGRVFSAASGTEDYPSRGQLGVPGLTWLTRPPGDYDQPHEITTLRGFDIAKIAAGDYHSLVLDKEGRVFSFGDNSYGQLGFDYNAESSIVDAPALIPIQRVYAGTNHKPLVTGIAAGGCNSYFMVDATKMARQASDDPAELRNVGRVTADTWSCGHGIWGGLGNGRWTHVQGTPTKIPALSGLFEYDERKNKAVPIRLARLSAGATHAAAVLDNITHVNASAASSEDDTNWGADILFFGNNEFYQLGTGKRNNVSSPIYIQPLDQVAERKVRGKEQHRFQITPRHTVKLDGRNVSMEQRVECGRSITAVYSGV